MKNLLVLSPEYPSSDNKHQYTPVVHYFAREWVKFGYNVLVVHYAANFPLLMCLAAKPFELLIGAKEGGEIRTKQLHDKLYELDGVKIQRFCLKKKWPHKPYSKREVTKAINKTINYCASNDFVPDWVIGHWPHPQLEIISILKHHFNAKSCFVSHGDSIKRFYGNRDLQLLNDVDIIGFRNDVLKKEFYEEYKIDKPSFVCYSGVPKLFIAPEIHKDFSDISKLIYVGTLIRRKYPSQIVKALSQAFGQDSFDMKYVGVGGERENIENEVKKYQLESRVSLLGRKTREEVISLLDESQIFIMISTGEAFGLVYLEAMARGCITIASRGEGFDGLIKHGVNGFLCEAGNADELGELLTSIRRMPEEELLKVSKNAMDTAAALTDEKAARYYSQALESYYCDKR